MKQPVEKIIDGKLIFENKQNGKCVYECERDGKKIRKVITRNTKKSLTDQSKIKETDANVIVNRYARTGEWPGSFTEGKFADVSEVKDLHQSLTDIGNAKAAFMALPAQIRARFENDMVKYVEFLQNPENDEEAIKLGLKTRLPNSDKDLNTLKEDVNGKGTAKQEKPPKNGGKNADSTDS